MEKVTGLNKSNTWLHKIILSIAFPFNFSNVKITKKHFISNIFKADSCCISIFTAYAFIIVSDLDVVFVTLN